MTDVERFARTDTSVTGQVLKVMASKPDAVLIAGSGTPAALPQKTLHERGYTGAFFQTHGVANLDFVRVGGKDVEGTILPAGPVLVADQLPDGTPTKAVGERYIPQYEAANGKGSASTFGAHAYDAGLLLQYAIPVALKTAKPGTPEFRSALRDALEGAHELVVTQGVMDMTPDNHNGFDDRARVMVTIKDGGWKLLLPLIALGSSAEHGRGRSPSSWLQDGIVNGAVYALLALSLVLVFSVTRVILIPQGELVAYGALTYAALDSGRVPGSLWLLGGAGRGGVRGRAVGVRPPLTAGGGAWLAAGTLLLPAAVAGLTLLLAGRHLGVAGGGGAERC